jgi:aminoglycoside 2'-N-acetyltransferase I
VRIARTNDLDGRTLREIRALLDAAFEGPLSAEDWEHALGGVHFIVESDGEILAHASVVARSLETPGRLWRTGYVEAVATRPDVQGRGHGTTVMRAVGEHIDESYELGSLSTGEDGFYEGLGWQHWRGRTGVRTDDGVELTPWEDDTVMVLLTDASAAIDLTEPITCEWRCGDVW